MKISIVRALEISDGDRFCDCVHYNFAGVFDEEAGASLAQISVPEGLPGWVASGMAGRPLFKVRYAELSGLSLVGPLVEATLTAIEVLA